MCYRCDQPEAELHDAHFWTAKATLHQAHVRAAQTEAMDRFLGKFGMKRVDMSKAMRVQADEIHVQPMSGPVSLPLLSSVRVNL